MPQVKTFRADTFHRAMQIVRRELGPQAVILESRELSHPRLLPWLKPRTEVEVTAGVGSAAAQRPAQEAEERSAPESGERLEQARRRREDLGIRWDQRPPQADGLDLDQFAEQTSPTPPPAAAHDEPQRPADQPERLTALESRLNSIQQMLEQLGQQQLTTAQHEVPVELFDLYTELLDAEVDTDLARELILRLKKQAPADRLAERDAARSLLTGMVEAEMRCSRPIQVVPQRRKVVALVGPTGVGKTTTIAKLAANFRLRDGVKMGLVTVDTYRIAAVEQLRTYAEIIDLPMQVVTSPLEMRRALDELSGMDLVLIDTAGRSPRDELKIQELKRLLDEAQVDEVHLVLSLTASLKSLESTVRNFRAANISSLILTKLDEASEMGNLLSVSRNIDLPVSYLTTGQNVPDDIEPAQAARLARLILGQDSVH